jgi:glucose-fructose oxidoreductase
MGTKARLEMDPATWYNGNRMWIERDGKIEQIEINEVDHFAAEMDHMSDCVMQNKQPLTPGEEGLRDLKIIEAVYESARSGKTVKLA